MNLIIARIRQEYFFIYISPPLVIILICPFLYLCNVSPSHSASGRYGNSETTFRIGAFALVKKRETDSHEGEEKGCIRAVQRSRPFKGAAENASSTRGASTDTRRAGNIFQTRIPQATLSHCPPIPPRIHPRTVYNA